ncbi:molecular chaperone [Diatrype stigma]|uniref:Molecular chaperone n=1 Tax=Diatrype stigma TaxID=117547 RepID=A0AAN9UMC3_9PEZI
MRSSFLLPRRQQVSRICDACRQQQKQQQQQQQQRNVASLSFLAFSSPISSSSKPKAHSPKRTIAPTSAPATTRSIHHSRALRSSAAKGEEQKPTAEAEAELPQTPPKTHYDFFPKTLPQGPPPAGPFHVDVRALRREYLALQAQAHPDRHPPGSKARAEALSARVNEAFATLANPFRRAVYVLDLKHEGHLRHQEQQQKEGSGVEGVGEAAARKQQHHADETAKLDDPELLGVVLEAREMVEEAQDEAELAPLREENEARIAESERAIEDAFARDDLDAAGREVVRLRYWVNIKESIDNWERGKPVVLEH